MWDCPGNRGDFGASEDAAQEAFLTAWRKIHELREPESLRAWLRQIARHVTWTPISQRVMPPAGSMTVSDSSATTTDSRFYRVVELP